MEVRRLSISLPGITLAYLALPLLIFLLGWVKLIYALPLAALLILLLVGLGRGGAKMGGGANLITRAY